MGLPRPCEASSVVLQAAKRFSNTVGQQEDVAPGGIPCCCDKGGRAFVAGWHVRAARCAWHGCRRSGATERLLLRSSGCGGATRKESTAAKSDTPALDAPKQQLRSGVAIFSRK
jgi:hypothetical protein